MNESLATFYRPQTFESVLGQTAVIKILKRQLELKSFKNAYLFCGPSGDGKTTLARIFAKEINHGQGSPIEIDGASNNGVDNVRSIIEDSKSRALDADYKIFIIDECHAISNAGWQAFLKCIEEPESAYTIFMFCTTDPQKIPATILNRVIRLNLTRVKTEDIKNRLMFISDKEEYTNYNEACDYIAKLSGGSVRTAISLLEKCAGFSNDLSMKNVLTCLGNFSYETFFDLTNSFIDGSQQTAIKIVEDCYNLGFDLKQFIEQYLDFVLDVNKYCIFHNIETTKIPQMFEKSQDTRCLSYICGIENNALYYNKLVNKILDIKNTLKYDTNQKVTIEIEFINICRGIL